MYKSQKRMNRISLILKRHTKMIVIQIEIRKKNQLEKKMSLLFQSLNNQSPSFDMLWTGNLMQFC